MSVIPQLETASVGRPITRQGVSLIPVYIHQILGQTIDTGRDAQVEIGEEQQEHVPVLTAVNRGALPVLLAEGETVNGGYQNRTLNVSVLLAAGATTQIPVSCVEAGRWGGGQRGFSRGMSQAPRRVRREKQLGVRDNVVLNHMKASDQGRVWSAVDYELQRLNVDAATSALAAGDEVFGREDGRDLARAIDELVQRGPLPGQCGVVVSHGSRVVQAEVFGAPELLAKQWEPLVRAWMYDAPGQVRGTPSLSRAVNALGHVATMRKDTAAGVGLGRELHATDNRVVAHGLVLDDALVHLGAFALA
jgi:hypothetical protein